MELIIHIVQQRVSGAVLTQLSKDVDVDEPKTEMAAASALLLLMAALARTAMSNDGALALHWALVMDHDGSVLDEVPTLAEVRETGMSGKLLKFVLRGQHEAAYQAMHRACGLDAHRAEKLMTFLAPLLLGALGRTQRAYDLDAPGVATVLTRQLAQVERGAMVGLVAALAGKSEGNVPADESTRGSKLGDIFPW